MHDRDIAAFSERASGYESGWRGRLHHEIADKAIDLALAGSGRPHRVLDVGCGTGYLLRGLAARIPEARELAGIDAAPAMIETARTMAGDRRIRFATATAEHLPYLDETFDLVISTTSFDHWSDQRIGLAECFRVLVPGRSGGRPGSWRRRASRLRSGMTCTPSSSAPRWPRSN